MEIIFFFLSVWMAPYGQIASNQSFLWCNHKNKNINWSISWIHIRWIFFPGLQHERRNEGQQQQIYLAIRSSQLNKAIITGNYSLFTPADILSYSIVDLLIRYLVSHETMKLDHSFNIAIKLLSQEHVQFRVEKKRNLIPHVPSSVSDFASGKKKVNSHNNFWQFDTENGYLDQPNVFETKCLILSCLIGYYHKNYLKNPRSKIGSKYKVISKLHSSKVDEIKEAGLFLNTEFYNLIGKIQKLQKNSETKLPMYGPYDVQKTLPLISQALENAIIIVYSNISKSKHWSSVEENDFTKPYIYLLFDPNSEQGQDNSGHMTTIIKPKTFFNLYGYHCLDCKKTVRQSSTIYHKCSSNLQGCVSCRRFCKEINFYDEPSFESYFCDKLTVPFVTQICDECNSFIYSENCQENHSRFCNQGFYCTICKSFKRKKTGETLEQAKKNHIHGEKECGTCHQVYIGNDHQCALEKMKSQTSWKNIGFCHFVQFSNEESNKDIFELKEKIFCLALEKKERESFQYNLFYDLEMCWGIQKFPSSWKMQAGINICLQGYSKENRQ